MAKYTIEDINRLAGEIRQAKDRNRPFAALIGAGCSIGAGIPLAPALVREIGKKYASRIARLPEAVRENYGACMGKLTASERKDILKPHLDKAKVNWANIALASLLTKGFLDRVLSINFDQVLARACGLCGYGPAIYDFGVSPAQTFDHLVEGCIIHLHGQSYGLTMMNSEQETAEHARALKPLVANTLERHPLLVIGYSGDNDHIFEVLKGDYKSKENLIWCGFVGDEPSHVRHLCFDAPGPSEFIGGVDADKFLIELAQALDCWPPLMLTQPESHLLSELAPVVDYPKELGGEDILQKIRTELQARKDERKTKAGLGLQQLLMEGKLDDVVARRADATTEQDKSALAWAYITQGNELSELAQTRQDEHLFKESFAKYEAAFAVEPAGHEALYNWGNALSDLAQMKQDEGLFRESFAKYEAALAIKPDMHEALYNWGNSLLGLARLKQDEGLFKESFAKYEAALAIKPDKQDAFYNWGNALLDLAQMKQDEGLFKESFAKYEAALAIKPDDDRALNNWGNALLGLAQLNQDESLFREGFAKYEGALAIKPDKHGALNNWGNALMALWRLNGDPALLDEAKAVLDRAERLKPEKAYDGACLASLRGDLVGCRERLERCLAAGTLPNAAHLMADKDLEPVRGMDWFRDIVSRRGADAGASAKAR